MHISSTDLDGRPLGNIDLTHDLAARLLVDGRLVTASRVVGSRVLLVITNDQVCISANDYWRIMKSVMESKR